jgi:hypothetical protein
VTVQELDDIGGGWGVDDRRSDKLIHSLVV